jgi:DNA-binding HxlR family transcriptional regulator
MSEIESKICKASGIGEVMGKKWSLSIIKILGTNSPLHFNELKKTLSGISNKILSERLQQLEREKLVVKTTITNGDSINLLYNLNPLALEFHKTLQDIDYWIDKWIDYKSKEQKEKSNSDNG